MAAAIRARLADCPCCSISAAPRSSRWRRIGEHRPEAAAANCVQGLLPAASAAAVSEVTTVGEAPGAAASARRWRRCWCREAAGAFLATGLNSPAAAAGPGRAAVVLPWPQLRSPRSRGVARHCRCIAAVADAGSWYCEVANVPQPISQAKFEHCCCRQLLNQWLVGEAPKCLTERRVRPRARQNSPRASLIATLTVVTASPPHGHHHHTTSVRAAVHWPSNNASSSSSSSSTQQQQRQ